MYEPTVTRSLGSDSTRPVWPGATGRPDAPSDGARPAPTPPPQPALQLPGQPDPADTFDTTASKDVAFPRSYARFSINKDTQRLSIKIVDAVTDQVIREIPPEEVQRIADELQTMTRRAAVGRRLPGSGEPPAHGGVDRYV